MRKISVCALILVIAVLVSVPLVREANGQTRTWTTLATIDTQYKAKPVTGGTPAGFPNGPDASVRKEFKVPAAGLIRITHRVDPYYAYGSSDKNPNTGGLGLSPEGEGWMGKEIFKASEPKNPGNNQPAKFCNVREIQRAKNGWVEVSAPVTYSGFAQLRLSHKVLVEFSPGLAREGETWDSSCNVSGGKPAARPDSAGAPGSGGETPAAGIAGTWAMDGNGYPGKLEITIKNGVVSARIYYDVAKKWETLTNVRFSGSTISFTRPWAGNPTFQQYTGTVRGSTISGTFTDNNTPGQRFNWSASK